MESENMRIHVGNRNLSSNSEQSSNSYNTTTTSDGGGETGSEYETQAFAGELGKSGEKEDLLTINYQRQNKTAKKVGIIVGAFIFCYFPFFTVFLIKSLHPNSLSLDVLIMIGWLRYFNSCLNPIIYAVMLKPFRKAFLQMYQNSVSIFAKK